jgi:hypothetical protein
VIKFIIVSLEFLNISTFSATFTVVQMASQAEQFFMPVLEEDGPDDTLFQQDGAPPRFHRGVKNFLNFKFPATGLSLGHHVLLTSLALAFSCLPLCRNFVRDAVAAVNLGNIV